MREDVWCEGLNIVREEDASRKCLCLRPVCTPELVIICLSERLLARVRGECSAYHCLVCDDLHKILAEARKGHCIEHPAVKSHI